MHALGPVVAKKIAPGTEAEIKGVIGFFEGIAEIELNVLTRQCLCRRIGDGPALIAEVGAWETRRNESQAGVDWQFTTADARVKLKRLYPRIQS